MYREITVAVSWCMNSTGPARTELQTRENALARVRSMSKGRSMESQCTITLSHVIRHHTIVTIQEQVVEWQIKYRCPAAPQYRTIAMKEKEVQECSNLSQACIKEWAVLEIKCMVTRIMKSACRSNQGHHTTITSLRIRMTLSTTMYMTHSIHLPLTSILRDSMKHQRSRTSKNKSWSYPISKSVLNSPSSRTHPIPARSSGIRMTSTIQTLNTPLQSSKNSRGNKTRRFNSLRGLWKYHWGILQCRRKVSS